MANTVAGILLVGDHASRPAGNAVPNGTLYSCTTHSLIYQSNYAGNSWSTWATLGVAASGSITASGYTQNTARLLGRTTASAGAIEEITVGSGLTLSAGSLTASGTASINVALLQDQKAQNTAGGTFTSGAWRTRDLNTEVSDAGNIVTISSNQFTPISGTYLLRAIADARAVDRHQARLQNVTAASTVQLGTSEYSPASGTGDAQFSTIDAVFTANGTDAYEIQHECQTTASTNGFGVAANLATEIYTSVILMKIG